jgi:predicted nucleic acid-binding protein
MATRNSLFVDTSGWASYIDKNDPWHKHTRKIYQQAVAKKRGFITTSYIIAELVALLESRSKLTRDQILDYVDSIQEAPSVEVVYIDKDLHIAALTMLKARRDKEWSLVGATRFLIMQ